MSALPPDQINAMRDSALQAKEPVGALARRWDELHRQAAELAGLAQLSGGAETHDAANFAERLTAAQQWQRELAWQGIEDIDAMMQPGITALKVITARGQDAGAPALALWREFHAAREAVLDMLEAKAPAHS
ncbi:hypothetical protein ACI5KX_01290 [Erythrobacter sp. GH1-10]|uniref:hypothetical protein n=1 Tax=Erythrobacter sp. GH1-10 TaxID=3349334 RepID=UPI003877D29B